MELKLRQARLSKNMSLGALASKTGIHSSYLSKIERGRAKPSPLVLSQIEAALNPPIYSSPEKNGNGKSSVVAESAEVVEIDRRNKLNDLSGKEWIRETKTIWRQRGLGANHPHTKFEKLHPAPFSFQDVGRVIRFFTKKGMTVVDPFVGVGSTLKAAALEGRKGIGVELSTKWAELARRRLDAEVPGHSDQQIWCMDICEAMARIPDDSVDLVVTSPPYWGILNKKADHKVKEVRLSKGLAAKYSDDQRDLANIPDYEKFLDKLSGIFEGLSAKVAPGKYCVIVVSDFKHGTRFYPFHSDLYERIGRGRFELQGVKILEQTHKGLYPYGYPFAYVPNIHHQYLLIFRRPNRQKVNGSGGHIVTRRGADAKRANIPEDLKNAVEQFRKMPYKNLEMAGRHWGHQRHEMCSFPSKVKPALASVLVKLFSVEGSRVLDPFSGCGSIPFEAAQQGRVAFGTDLSPLSTTITSAKICAPEEKAVEKLLERLERHLKKTAGKSDVSEMEPEILEFYQVQTAREIIAAKKILLRKERDKTREAARLFVLACLAHIMHGNRPYALSRRSHNIIPIRPKGARVYKPVMKSLGDKCRRMLAFPLPVGFKNGVAMTAAADGLPLKGGSIDTVLTSPPFLGSTHFLRQNRVRNWLMGWGYEKQGVLKGRFLEHQKGVEGYRPIFKELHRVMKPGGIGVFHIGIVNTVSMADLFAPLFIEAGFKEVARVWEDARSLETHGRTDRGGTHTHGFVIVQRD